MIASERGGLDRVSDVRWGVGGQSFCCAIDLLGVGGDGVG